MRIFLFRSFFTCFALFLFVAAPLPEKAQERRQSQTDAERIWEDIYANALNDLNSVSGIYKARGAHVLGAQGNPRFVRPLLAELLKGLRYAKQRKGGADHTYPKSVIAWALGNIGHPLAVPGMLDALTLSINLSQEQVQYAKEYGAKRQVLTNRADGQGQEQANSWQAEPGYITIEPDRPGPFLQRGMGFYYNADQYWSLADEFKSEYAGPIPTNYAHQTRLKGTNYANLATSIFIALGRIGSATSIEKISTYLEPNTYPEFVRNSASSALGAIGTSQAIEKITSRFTAEKSPAVILSMAFAVLRNDKSQTAMYTRLTSFLQNGNVNERFQAALAFRELGMGEALENLQAAYQVENELQVRAVLRSAIRNARRDTIFSID